MVAALVGGETRHRESKPRVEADDEENQDNNNA